MGKHTPGPWKYWSDNGYGDTRFYIAQEDGAPYTSGYSDVATLIAETVSGEKKAVQEANARLIAAAPDLLEALKGLLDDVQGLMSESDGVAGLHLNGDVADWESLDEGGSFERLSNMSAAMAAISKATAP